MSTPALQLRSAADFGRRWSYDAGLVRGQRRTPDGSTADRCRVQCRCRNVHVLRSLVARRDRQPPGASGSCSPIWSTSTCVGRSISSTRGVASTNSIATTTSGSGPSWCRPTRWKSSATGRGSSTTPTGNLVRRSTSRPRAATAERFRAIDPVRSGLRSRRRHAGLVGSPGRPPSVSAIRVWIWHAMRATVRRISGGLIPQVVVGVRRCRRLRDRRAR
jgi:hypothetical protein